MVTGKTCFADGIRDSGRTLSPRQPEDSHLVLALLGHASRPWRHTNPTVRCVTDLECQPVPRVFPRRRIAVIRQNNYTVGLMRPHPDTILLPDLTFLTQDEVRRLFA